MTDLPESFAASLDTTLSRRRIARLYKAPTWTVRTCGWTEYEIVSPFAELVLEAESPVLLRGPAADVVAHLDQILGPLRAASITYQAECYDAGDVLLYECRRAPG